MTRLTYRCAFTALGITLAAWAGAEEVNQAGYQSSVDGDNAVVWSEALRDLNEGVEQASFNSYSAGGSGVSLLPSGRGSRFFIGGEALWVKAHPSQAVAYDLRDLTDIASPSDTFTQFDFDRDASYRFYGGCRNCCGEEIRFTWTHFDSGADFVSPESNGTTIQIISPLENVAVIDGDRTTGSADVELDSFDLGWSKTIPLGSPLGCCDSGCGDCCDPCGCGWCPAWDITFTGAFRAVDMGGNRRFNTISDTGEVRTEGRSRFDFEGAGARVGLLGRRYFGRKGICSVYMKGDLSLLVGDYNTVQERNSAATPGQVTRQSISCTHVIPVTEIEVGGTMFITCNTSISGGYFISAWHDLGFRDEYEFNLNTHYDDANIMGFDGVFVRMETTF